MLDIADVGSGVVAGLQADLAASSALSGVSASAAGQFQVDLAHLYSHYNDVVELYNDLGTKLKGLVAENPNACILASEIDGVAQAVDATLGASVQAQNSLVGGLQAVLDDIGNYAAAIADVYKSYVNADQSGASTLTSVSTPDAANVGLPSH